MREIELTFANFGNSVLPLGMTGENFAMKIYVDCTAVFTEFPYGHAALTINPPEGTAYPGDIVTEDGVVFWQVRSRDLMAPGRGTATLSIVDSFGTVLITATATTVIQGTIPPGVEPDQISDWLQAASVALSETQEALDDMEEAIAEISIDANVQAAVAAMNDKKDECVSDIGTAATSAKNTAVAAIGAEGTRVLATIPSDYSDLSAAVGPDEASSTASAAHPAGSYFIYDGGLYEATLNIAAGGTIVTSGTGQNCRAVPGGIAEEVVDLKSALDDVNSAIDDLPFEGYTPTEDTQHIYYDLSFTTKAYANTQNVTTVDIQTLSGYKYAVTSVSPGEVIHVTTYWHQNIKAVIFTDSADLIIDKYPSTSASHQLFDETVTVPAGATKMYINGETVTGRTDSSAYKIVDNGTVYLIDENVFRNKLGLEQKEYVLCVRNGDNIQVKSKCKGISGKIGLNAVLGGSRNGGINFDKYIIISPDANDKIINAGTTYKEAGDDICPFKYGGSYRGGNHGYALAHKITAADHGLTAADIGSVWSSNGKEYIIVTIIDTNNFMIVYKSSFANPVSPLVHVSGGTHTSDIAFTAQATDQIVPGAKDVVTEIYSSTGSKLTNDGYIYGDYIDITETGTLISVSAMKTYLETNVGNNTNTSYYSDDIAGDMMYQINYRFLLSGCCLVATNIVPLEPISNFDFAGLAQLQSIGTTAYVPYTDLDTPGTISGSNKVFTPSTWNDENFPPYKYYQFDSNGKGFALGYIIDFGQGLPNTRKTTCSTDAGNINASTNKVYPYFRHGNGNIGMNPVCGYAFRAPVIRENNICVIWYELGNARYFEIEVFAAFNGVIALDGATGKRIEVIKKDTEAPIIDIAINGIYINTNSHCSVTVKCY